MADPLPYIIDSVMFTASGVEITFVDPSQVARENTGVVFTEHAVIDPHRAGLADDVEQLIDSITGLLDRAREQNRAPAAVVSPRARPD